MSAQGYFLPDGVWVPQDELTALTPDGKEAALRPATVGVEVQAIEITAEQALSLSFTHTYALEIEDMPAKIKTALDGGKIFSFPFNVKDDYNTETAILVGNESGYFALIGNPINYQFCKLENFATVTENSSDSSNDDLDFEMF